MIFKKDIPQPVSMSLIPYSGPWTKEEAGHLLRRSLFGFTYQQLTDTMANGMAASVTSLMTTPTLEPPLTYHPDEAIAAFGDTWVNSVYPTGDSQPTENARSSSIASWIIQRLTIRL
ncbi:MAG: hypothetical protein ACI9XP_000785 [Lentimonas sp.]|jgi:hypothetical protein